MNEKEISEIRRKLKNDECTISAVYGCYVSKEHEIISRFRQPFGPLHEEESEKYLSLFRKTLSGVPGKNLLSLSFDTEAVLNGEEHKRLMALKESCLKDEKLIDEYFGKIAENITMKDNFVILLAYNTYDVPHRAADGSRIDADSDEVFSYLISAVCPVKMSKPILSYDNADKDFRSRDLGWVVSAPEIGFMFPAFDDRKTNIYGTMYYTKSTGDLHEDFAETVFRTPLPMNADTQKETFETAFTDALEKDCSMKVVRCVHQQIREKMEEHKETHSEEPLVVTGEDVREALQLCGVSDEKITAFEKGYTESFGAGAEIPPQNLIDPKHFRVQTPEVTIQVNPKRTDLIETRVIDGVKYVLVRADDGVEVNGVEIHINP